jgi:hypothetical protein
MTDDLIKLGNGLADTLMRAAEEQVSKAQMLLDQTKALVEIIRNQVSAQAKQNDDMVARFKDVGERMLDIHRMLNGDPANSGSMQGVGFERQQPAPPHDLVQLRALDALRHGRLDPAANYGTSDPRASDISRRAPDLSRTAGGLPRAVGGVSQFDPRANRDRGEDNHNPT